MIIIFEAILGLGSNLRDRINNIKKAIHMISLLPSTEISMISGLYETVPFETPTVQNKYINACIKVYTKLSAHVLLGGCLGIEACFGRKRPYKNSPRIIDIDLLLYEDETYCDDDLILPHPEIKRRDFVLIPLNDICDNMHFKSYNFSKEYTEITKNSVKTQIPEIVMI